MGAELSVRGLRHVRGGRVVLDVGAVDVADGARLCVLGPNGAGKTTLLRLVAAVEPPRQGRITIDGISPRDGGVALRRRVAYVTQRPALLSTSVLRNVELPLRWRKMPKGRRGAVAAAALERLRVAHLADRPATALSGGEQQRVSLARALAVDPDVLLLDEPAAGLDAQSRTAFLADLGRALAGRATTVVHVSHRPEEAMLLADQVMALLDGRVHQIGPPEVLTRRPVDASVAALVGYDNLVDAYVEADGAVTVGGAPSGLTRHGPAGPATAAVFGNGVRLAPADGPGIPMRVAQVAPGPGHWTVALEGAAPLLAKVPLDHPPPAPGDRVAAAFAPDLSAVLPKPGAPTRPDTPR
ncbi:iron(III) transport system ATP-binding protein/tungstate transport system ATP-binding protein [Murinocardiopsis flavida]|uniref:Iron(III) transport system ATP-binding protein/tungstate transport system ATP-binding protein n=1 Tax=Murinocardiopsis flavida TaxID=645275 RepID=A0A2P8DKH2_9ACTN|nr:ABC transporter ATP-binding protein [Murinocardiopsis flavida]PSK97727.1 iron(III) transport system ATP-binding protein/tungstate transport system ATP-binding protein [Murinocardiopsis flavida]